MPAAANGAIRRHPLARRNHGRAVLRGWKKRLSHEPRQIGGPQHHQEDGTEVHHVEPSPVTIGGAIGGKIKMIARRVER